MARPTRYTDELGAEIADLVATGGSLLRISEKRGMPSLRTMLLWTSQHPSFDLMLAHARCIKADLHVDECVPIADEPATTLVEVARNRLRVQARLDAAAKLNPRKYGAKLGIGQAPELPPINSPHGSQWAAARRFLFGIQIAARILEHGDGESPPACEPGQQRIDNR